MSFLAKLRQNQQPSAPVGLQLCYIVRRNLDGRVLLALILSSIEQGRLRELGKPYIIQRAHLNQPPSFLSALDVSVLNELLKGSDAWLSQNEQSTFPIDVHPFIERLMSTQKCFVQHSATCVRPLGLGGCFAAEPVWNINGAGEQSLSWVVPEGAYLWLFNDWPYAFDPNINQLSQAVGEKLPKWHKVVSRLETIEPNFVNDFLGLAKTELLENDLPMPIGIASCNANAELQAVLYFKGCSVQLQFRYITEQMSVTCFFEQNEAFISVWNGQQLINILRQNTLEKSYLHKLLPYVQSLNSKSEACWTSDEKAVWMNVLLEQRSDLYGMGFVFQFDESFKHHYIAPTNWSVGMDRVGEKQWQFTLSFDIGEQTVDVVDLLRRLKVFNQNSREQYQEISLDGKTLVLSPELMGTLSVELGDLVEFNQVDTPIPLSQLHRLKKLKDALPQSTQWHGETALLERSIDLHSSPIMMDSQSSGVKAELRPYQWLGVCWIQHLKQSGFNGLLADDMGLGKTLQTLAHLSLEQKNPLASSGTLNDKSPSLIIAPTSLLSNWVSEIKKFCPHLSYIVLHGSQRHSLWEEIKGKDVVITSYPLLVRDIEKWQQQSIAWLVLDEAQVIKNPSTKVSQAVRSVQSEYRLCLSGTPVENHLGELWSILDFLEPDILGSQQQFRSYYQASIEENANQERFTQLLSRIEPFVLRRTKSQVAHDLPAKTQIKKMVTLSDVQMDFYNNLKDVGRDALNNQLETIDNKGTKQILLLTALMRLRQACCDPALIEDEECDKDLPSAKTEYCLHMLKELVEEGRSVLVFSQFTSMLKILSNRLDEKNIDYLMLTGKSKNRSDLVDQFQAGKAPVFLISLKAGGVGLNLTRADTVIHFDPWWNQAAEEQASDRAHRIGQKNPVFVYKLIAEGTIEEKIAVMQERKSILSRQVNHQAQLSGETFALKLEDMLSLLDETEI